MIAAVATVWNEGDIVGASFGHLQDEGVDEIYVALRPSFDESRQVLEGLGARIYDDHDTFHMQRQWSTALAEQAMDDGADWVLAVDADEFWYANDGRIKDVLAEQPDDVGILCARMFQHWDWDHREMHHKPLGKVAFRPEPGLQVADGNHNVAGVPGKVMWGFLDLREYQYRGFDHFVRKVRERCETLDPTLPWHAGTHMTRLRGFTVEELRREWDLLRDVDMVFDPIPSRRHVP